MFLTVFSPSVSSKTPASPAKLSQEPNAVSNLGTQSPKKENLGCGSGRLLMTPLHLKASNHRKRFLSFILQKIKALSKVSSRAQNTKPNSKRQLSANPCFIRPLLPPSSLETIILRDPFFSISLQTILF